MTKLMGYSQDSMADPMKGFAPVRDAAMQGINATYADLPGQVSAQMARRGYGSSGAMGNSMYKVGLARAGALSSLEGTLATKGIDQQNFGSQLGMSLLNAGKGTSTSTTGNEDNYSTSWQKGATTGTGTTPDMSASNGLLSGGNALSNLSTLLMLQKVLSGGGGGSPGGGGGTDYSYDPSTAGNFGG